MSPLAKGLPDSDIVALSAYYANVNGGTPSLPAPDPALVDKGRQLARIGDAGKEIQACNNCHGPDGVGIPPAVPYLAGQYKQYIEFELHMWQRGFRKSSSQAMGVIAKQLDDQDIAAVAAFYQQAGNTAASAANQ